MTVTVQSYCNYLLFLLVSKEWLSALNSYIRESSFNMTRGGDEDIEGAGLQKVLGTQKGGSEKN